MAVHHDACATELDLSAPDVRQILRVVVAHCGHDPRGTTSSPSFTFWLFMQWP